MDLSVIAKGFVPVVDASEEDSGGGDQESMKINHLGRDYREGNLELKSDEEWLLNIIFKGRMSQSLSNNCLGEAIDIVLRCEGNIEKIKEEAKWYVKKEAKSSGWDREKEQNLGAWE